MSGTVIVGVIISLMFLVSFSEWFYHLAAGVNEVVVRDLYFYYRIGLWAVGGVMLMLMVFWILSLINECPADKEREGLFRYLNCDVYWKTRSALENKPESMLREEVFNQMN